MGFLDVLTGKRKIKGPAPDRVFAMATAGPVLEMSMGLKPARAAIVFQPLATSDFDAIVADMEEVLKGTGDGPRHHDREAGRQVRLPLDDPGRPRLRGPRRRGQRRLDRAPGAAATATACWRRCSPSATRSDKPVYWIYNYKRGAFYPFVPGGGEQQRDSERELQLQAQIGAELPVEAQLERWFPLWDIPI